MRYVNLNAALECAVITCSLLPYMFNKEMRSDVLLQVKIQRQRKEFAGSDK